MAAVGEQSRQPEPSADALAGPVLACVDEGPGGLAATRIAGSLARWLGSHVLLATVQQTTPVTPIAADLTAAALRHGRALLRRAAREVDEGADMRVALGEPAERLLSLAEREAAELIVVAAPDPSRMPTRLGSVYLALAGAAPCPVVVIPPGVDRIATTGPIVCGGDGSEASSHAAGVAADLARRLETRLLLVEDGPPAERLAGVADREAAQLLVTGSHGGDQDAAALLGSVASELATSATRPLMIVPPTARQRGALSGPALAARRLRNGAAVLSVPGEVDPAITRRLERQGARLLTESGGRLVVDLSAATAIDRRTARVVDRLARQASAMGGQLALVARPSIRDQLGPTPHPWALVTDAFDAALDAVGER